MLPRCNNIKTLLRAPITRLQCHRDQVLAEISRGGIHEQTLAGGRLDRGGGEGARGGIVARVGFGSGFWIEDTAGAGDIEDAGGVSGVERMGEGLGLWAWGWEGGGKGEEGESENLGAHYCCWWGRSGVR